MALDFLKAEIAKKKRKLQEDELYKSKKYVKLGEIEELRQKEYMERQREKELKKRSRSSAESDDENGVREKNLTESQEAAVKAEAEQPQLILPRDEVMNRLRMRGEPITLFGESDIQRAERLRKLELKVPMEYVESSGAEFLKIIREEEENEQDKAPEDQLAKLQDEDPDFKLEHREPKCIEEEILFFFRKAWWEWHDELDRRSELERRTAQGRHDTATLKQTRAYLKPLFQGLLKRSIGQDILKEITVIYKNCVQRDYVVANDAYYRLAIGNAPWPMGVTMVGIHERSAREKIHSASVAHVLNDETQRKYIQGVKRLMTFLQKKYPTAPSKSVM